MRAPSPLAVSAVERVSTFGEAGSPDHGDVDQEDGAPPEVVQEPAADDRAERHAERRGGRDDADGLGLLVGAEERGQDGQGERHDQRTADTHDRAGDDHPGHVAGQGAQHRAGEEDAEPGDEHPPPSEAVAEEPGGEHQRREDDDVRVRHPLLPARGGAELFRHGRQRHVQDRHVEAEDQHARDQGPEGPPAAGIAPHVHVLDDSSHEMKVALKI
jgi:hypothetical protein